MVIPTHRGKTVTAAVFLLALSLCLLVPQALAAVTLSGRIAVYAALLLAFARSLLPGRTAIATRLALRIHGTISPRRSAYTRAVTWLWTMYFAAQLLASLLYVVWPASATLHWATTLHLPIAAGLFGLELAVRSLWFRGQPHGSATDMLRAFHTR